MDSRINCDDKNPGQLEVPLQVETSTSSEDPPPLLSSPTTRSRWDNGTANSCSSPQPGRRSSSNASPKYRPRRRSERGEHSSKPPRSPRKHHTRTTGQARTPLCNRSPRRRNMSCCSPQHEHVRSKEDQQKSPMKHKSRSRRKKESASKRSDTKSEPFQLPSQDKDLSKRRQPRRTTYNGKSSPKREPTSRDPRKPRSSEEESAELGMALLLERLDDDDLLAYCVPPSNLRQVSADCDSLFDGHSSAFEFQHKGVAKTSLFGMLLARK